MNITPGKTPNVHAEVSAHVTNNGEHPGEETVQLYVQDKVASITCPFKELKGIKKISLKPGEHKTVTCSITNETLGFYDNEMNYKVEPGDFIFMIGGSSDKVQQIDFTLRQHRSPMRLSQKSFSPQITRISTDNSF